MSAGQLRRTMATAKAIVGHLGDRIGPAAKAINAELANVDGFGTGGFGGGRRAPGVGSSSVERAAGGRGRATRDAERLTVLVTMLRDMASEAVAICDRYDQGPPVEYETLRCSAGPGLPWWRDEWGDGCDNVVPPARQSKGVCDRCRMRAHRAGHGAGVFQD